jgi:MFS family permease
MPSLEHTVRRNTFLLAAATALNWTVIVQLAALTTLTTAHLFALPELAGLAFGLFLLAFAAGGLLIGRLMDGWGRRNSLIAAFLVGAAGALALYFGVSSVSLPLAVGGLLVIGMGTGGANLTRVAGADMYPPRRRPRGISLVLFGAAIGAIGAPIVFGPLLAGARSTQVGALAAPWPVAAALLAAAALVLLAIRLDPREIAEQLRLRGEAVASGGAAAGERSAAPPGRSLAELFRLPMVPLALLAAVVAQAVMTSTMALAGLAMADHGHDLGAVSLTISVHFVGMFGFALVVGPLVERIGRLRAVLLGLVVLAGGVLALLPAVELMNFVPGMFAVGIGWNFAYVASTTILADVAQANERGRLLGASDFIALVGAAMLAVVAGLVLDLVGLPAMIALAVLMALVPAALIALNRGRLEGARAS